MQPMFSSDLMRASARFAPDGRPFERNTENLMRFRQEQAEDTASPATAPRGPSLFAILVRLIRGPARA